jgi:hypothetical protein
VNVTNVEKLVFSMRHRVILPAEATEGGATKGGATNGGATGDGATAARQVDAVLMSAGFKCSAELLAALGGRGPEEVIDLGVAVIGWARELAGGHVKHNAYFIDFPKNVPDTVEFWLDRIREAMAGQPLEAVTAGSVVDLLSLPKYGSYQHAYEEMLARHEELVPALSDRVTLLHLGGPVTDEASALYRELAGSPVPLSAQALAALRFLAGYHGGAILAEMAEMKVRENKAIVNAARVRNGLTPQADTPTDVLRVAAELSGGDVTLVRPARFRSLPRAQRRVLLSTLDEVAPGRLADVNRHPEQWKRLGERLHPHEWAGGHQSTGAADVFAVARGEKKAMSLNEQVGLAWSRRDVAGAARLLATAPGMLWRAADYVLAAVRRLPEETEASEILGYFAATAPRVSGRVLLSVREHLSNRTVARPGSSRIFVNRKGLAWVTSERRPPLDAGLVSSVLALIDAEIESRLPDPGRLLIDPAIETVALPLSGKAAPAGLRVFPRGSVTPVDGDLLRFFVYWKQAGRRTDFDLSAIITDGQFGNEDWLSYTNLRNFGGEHSGDITDAPDGATEFINIHLDRLGQGYVIPQVYVFSGEGFDDVAENFFGFMTMGEDQRGAPFEPRTVRARSALHGDGRTAMPLAFYRGEDGRWYAKWLHLYLSGRPAAWGGVRVEENRLTSRLHTKSMMERDYLRVAYLTGLLRDKAAKAAKTGAGDGPVTYIGVEQPEELPENSTVYTLANLASLIPA